MFSPLFLLSLLGSRGRLEPVDTDYAGGSPRRECWVHRSLSEPNGCWPHLLGSDSAAALPLTNRSISPATRTFLTAIHTIFHVHLVSCQMQISAPPPPPQALERSNAPDAGVVELGASVGMGVSILKH